MATNAIGIEYYIGAWTWDEEHEEYVHEILFETRRLELAEKVYDTTFTSEICPQVELWETSEESQRRLKYKEA